MAELRIGLRAREDLIEIWSYIRYTGAMEIELSPELQAKLERIASEQGCDSKSLVHEAVERSVGYDEWFIREVEKGLAQVDRRDAPPALTGRFGPRFHTKTVRIRGNA